ncbi:MAG TPA: type II secretion system protein [Candidatus Aminicenantes bacterium]|nr:type II secretion system protein [Candidatus Aminicenantes bacterium]
MTNRPHRRPDRGGFTLIEVLVVLGIIGILMAVAYPSILNTMAVRNLENQTRQVQTYLQQTKLRAVDAKFNHRVRFYQADGGAWVYEMERMQANLATRPPTVSWVRVPGPPRKAISARLAVTLTLPAAGGGFAVEFSPTGAVANFDVARNAIVLRDPNLRRPGRMDERVLSLFMGGSIHYAKRASS